VGFHRRISRVHDRVFLAGHVVCIFTAEPHGPWLSLIIILLLVTCPGCFAGFLAPILNAGIYSLVGFFVFKLRESSRRASRGGTVGS
jgi:hypothetical protein